MKQLTPETKKTVLDLLLKTSIKRIIDAKKNKEIGNPCYDCLQPYLGSNIT
jgi:hypothetical protein